MNLDFLKDLMQTPEGQALKEFFISKIEEMNSIMSLPYSDPDKIAFEARSRQLATYALREMLSPLIDATQFDIIQEKDDSISAEMLLPERSQDSTQD